MRFSVAKLASQCLEIHLQPCRSMILECDFKGCSLSSLATETENIFTSCHTQYYYDKVTGRTYHEGSHEVKEVQT